MHNIVCFSGGKDSTALVLWAKDTLGEFTTVFCDTGWEHPITYAYVEEINQQQLGGAMVYLHSEKYEDLMECWLDHHIFSNASARFCTEDMKIVPLHKFFGSIDDEVTAYQGIRADESQKRMRMRDEEWVDDAGGYLIRRPLFRWTAKEVFDFHETHGIEPNPLYRMGASRVGCWPCVLANLRDIKAFLIATPEIKSRLIEAEQRMWERTGDTKRTFFPAGFIPDRFCSQNVTSRKGREVGKPTSRDVFRYLERVDEDQLPLLPARSCMSVYNLCE